MCVRAVEEAAVDDLDKGLVPRPCPLVMRRRDAEHRRRFQLRPQRPKLGPSLRRDPRFLWQSVLLAILAVAVVAWNLGLRGS